MAANKKYKRDYLDAVKNVIPTFYFTEDYDISGYQRTATDSLVNSHINFCINQPGLLNISATQNSADFSSLNTFAGIAPYFIVQNNTTDITSRDFELGIMHPLGYCIGEYTGQPCTFFTGDNSITNFVADQKTTFINFLSETLLPKLTLNSSSLATTTASAFDNTASGTHNHLINKLGWAYFLNTSGADTSYSPSSYIASSIADIYYTGSRFDTLEGIKGLEEYVWYGWSTLSSTYPLLMPTSYVSGGGTYTSSTQNLDAIKSLVDVVYSTKLLNKEDTYVRDAIDTYISTSSLLVGQELAAPFSRFLQAMSYSFFDTNEDVSKLKSINNLEECPDELLPYLADLIGWRVYGSSPDSWRRQIRGAPTLYKQKGTKEGLYNAITTVLPSIPLETSTISEFYESYVPFLIYYLLKTDTAIFDSFESFSFKVGQDFIYGDYSFSDMDHNIRRVIDWMLLRAVVLFPDLFWVNNFKFDINDPEFSFFFRGRSFPIPPWEDEKFYRNCDITEDLATFLERELVCLGVAETNARSFKEYILNNTVQGSLDTKFYDNGFWFLTSSINQPPNRDYLIDNFQIEKYDYIPLWNGKSSHFDIDVSTGTFESDFFQGKDFLKQDFFESLAVIDNFSPAKAIPRTRVTLDNVDTLSSLDYICPSLRYWIQDIPPSGAQGGAYTSGMSFSGIAGAFGSDYPTPANASRAANSHAGLPVFRRGAVDEPLDMVNLAGSALSASPITEGVFRNAMRRRNFSKTLQKGGLYKRSGFNMPSYFNTSSEGSDVEYQPLGLLNLLFSYHKVINPYNLLETSSFPYNLDVWSKCWDLTSDNMMSGIAASSTFDIRGTSSLTLSTCNSYVARDRTPDFYKYLNKILEKKFEYQANYVADKNSYLTAASSFLDASASIKNILIANTTLTDEDMYNIILGQRRVSVGSLAGIHKTFKDFITYYGGHGTGNGLLETQYEGGLNIISHAYAPLLYNAYYTIDGSGVDLGGSSNLICKTTFEENPFSVKDLTGLNNITVSSSSELYVGGPEYRNPFVLSGIEFTDSVSGTSTFTIFDLDPSTAVIGATNYLVNNPIVLWKPNGGLSRMRYSVKDYGPLTNLLVPEHEFEFSLRGTVGTEDSKTLGNGAFGVWLHTDIEYDYHGNQVVWTYMPTGTWEMTPVSSIQDRQGPNYVKDNLSHVLAYSESYQSVDDVFPCFLTESTKDVLIDMSEDDFQSRTFKFSTKNNLVKVPLSYYQAHNQVHRSNQRYIVELFMFDNADTKKFGITDHISIQDTTQYERLKHKHSFTYANYDHAEGAGLENFIFLDSNGNPIPTGAYLTADINGNLTTSSGDKVTFKEAQSFGYIWSNYVLFNQVAATEKNKWVEDANRTQIQIPAHTYIGTFQVGASSTIEPDTITITGKTKGSNITEDVTLYIPLEEDETLAIIREFNRLQQGLAARNPDTVEDGAAGPNPPGVNNPITLYGPEGGSRLNYKAAPMWSQIGGLTTFSDDNNQYTDIYLEN